MKALILSAGRGTRLRPITNYIPKPMLPLHGRPLMEWVMLPLIACGIKDFVVAVSYLAEQVKNYFGRGERWGVRINYCYGPEPAGKAGEIWRAREFLGSGEKEENFLVVPGDTLCQLNYRELFHFHRQHRGPVSVAFSTRYRLEVGTAEIDENSRVVKFHEKSNLNVPVSTGAYVLDNRIFPYIEAFSPGGKEVDLPGDVFPELMAERVPIYGFVRDYAWWDVGRISDYESLLKLKADAAAEILTWGSNHGYL
ncbi:nucleotidyl transferase [Desulfocucumis palustris]|uniref:Nucleotidyl transferase n=1 Tax=Desulfocucumis palustris TaxID=1898651 RepID=A0A2L2X8P0_9FIRM|nr:nucleotidyltransferase family protein [Desulfocucumis palustris]GBF31943.1 nucleotidyl transferase [Desulfocucumis palustris]